MDKIVLPRIEIMACHGVEEWEKTTPQPFLINVEMGLDLRQSAITGCIEDTVHYGEIYAAVKDLAENSSYDLIESLAQAIAELCLANDRVETVTVAVEKTQARYADMCFPARVVIERSR